MARQSKTVSRMERWSGKVAMVTGASSGIGESVAIRLVANGMKVIGLARRLDKLQELGERLRPGPGVFVPVRCDVSKEEDILEAFRIAKEEHGGVDVLVNNAGTSYAEWIIEDSTQHMREILEVNVLAAAMCIREATKSMLERNVEGQVIIMNSVLGVNANKANSPISLYQPSKCALTSIAEVVRTELTLKKAKVKVTNLAPGIVRTDMPLRLSDIGDKIFDMFPYMEAEDVADAVVYILGTPPSIVVQQLVVSALNDGLFLRDDQ